MPFQNLDFSLLLCAWTIFKLPMCWYVLKDNKPTSQGFKRFADTHKKHQYRDHPSWRPSTKRGIIFSARKQRRLSIAHTKLVKLNIRAKHGFFKYICICNLKSSLLFFAENIIPLYHKLGDLMSICKSLETWTGLLIVF